MSKIKIALDRGHSDQSPGAVFGDIREVELNTSLTKELEALLTADGRFEILLCCPYTENRTIQERATSADLFGASLLISNHFNAGKGTGFEVFREVQRGPVDKRFEIYRESLRFGELLCSQMKPLTKIRGVKERWNSEGTASYFGLIRMSSLPCVVVETAFIDTPDDIAKFLTPEGLHSAALAQYRTILEYFGLEAQSTVHWGSASYESLIKKGLVIHETRFNDFLTRAELFAILDRIVK